METSVVGVFEVLNVSVVGLRESSVEDIAVGEYGCVAFEMAVLFVVEMLDGSTVGLRESVSSELGTEVGAAVAFHRVSVVGAVVDMESDVGIVVLTVVEFTVESDV